jgi:hypothetical protein
VVRVSGNQESEWNKHQKTFYSIVQTLSRTQLRLGVRMCVCASPREAGRERESVGSVCMCVCVCVCVCVCM